MTTTTTTEDITRPAAATLVHSLLWRRVRDLDHARTVLNYVQVLRAVGAPAAQVAKGLDMLHTAVRFIREDNAQLADVTLCPCGSATLCGCVVPF